jgi:hypothetical protein
LTLREAVLSIRCFVRQEHAEVVRSRFGSFTCIDCGFVGASLDAMGHRGDGYVNLSRPIFNRDKYISFTRDSEEPHRER